MIKDGFKIVGTKYLEPVYNIKDLNISEQKSAMSLA